VFSDIENNFKSVLTVTLSTKVRIYYFNMKADIQEQTNPNEMETNTQTNRQTNRQKNRQTNRQTNTQTNTNTFKFKN
jgi:hypothetical protein